MRWGQSIGNGVSDIEEKEQKDEGNASSTKAAQHIAKSPRICTLKVIGKASPGNRAGEEEPREVAARLAHPLQDAGFTMLLAARARHLDPSSGILSLRQRPLLMCRQGRRTGGRSRCRTWVGEPH